MTLFVLSLLMLLRHNNHRPLVMTDGFTSEEAGDGERDEEEERKEEEKEVDFACVFGSGGDLTDACSWPFRRFTEDFAREDDVVCFFLAGSLRFFVFVVLLGEEEEREGEEEEEEEEEEVRAW